MKTSATSAMRSDGRASQATALTGVLIGSAISMLLWAFILAMFFALR